MSIEEEEKEEEEELLLKQTSLTSLKRINRFVVLMEGHLIFSDKLNTNTRRIIILSDNWHHSVLR